jgi:tRNA threonylcarbamoyladenosine biosynthesis protein TsaE
LSRLDPDARRAGSAMNLRLADADATAQAGAAIAAQVAPGMVITLDGDLGAGKTTLVRGLLRAAGVQGPIKSPTYDLVEHYPLSSIYFYHIDLYRFTDADEWEGSGLSECVRPDAVVLVEWPSRVGARLPIPDLALALRWPAHGDGRILEVHAHGTAGERCRAALIAALRRA